MLHESPLLHRIAQALAAARSTLVLTGAGMSAESGLPTFRGAGGYWGRHRVEDLASPEGFARDPQLVWNWYNERIRAYSGAQPNAGHYALAQLERLMPGVTIATQNVDSLHSRAGSSGVLELHGHLRTARCTRCGAQTGIEPGGFPLERIEHACGGRFRPQVVWFGETLPPQVWAEAEHAAARADAILVVGTSSQVYPAAALAKPAGTAFVAEINPGATAISERCAVTVRLGAAVALPQIVEALTAASS